MTQKLDDAIRKFEKRQIVFSVLGLVVLILASVVINRLQVNSLADETTNIVSQLGQVDEFREVVTILSRAQLDTFKKIQYVSNSQGRSYSIPPSNPGNSPDSRLGWLINDSVTVPVVNPLDAGQTDRIVYVYNRFRFVPYAALIWFLLILVSIPQTRLMKSKIVEQWQREIDGLQDRAQAAVAKDVRHNLRSPLAALMRLPARLPDSIKSDRELLKSTIDQIKALIAQLGHGTTSLPETSVISKNEIYDTLIESAQETAMALPPEIQFVREIDDAIVSAQVKHVPHELRAVIGNIVINSVEAIEGQGTILLKARDMADHIEIEVQDSGRGIPADVIDHIFDEGFSHGKEGGTGRGLAHAKRFIEEWGGTIAAKSEPGNLTTVTIQLPVEERASWYLPQINLDRRQPILVVEDQEAARQLWRIRFAEAGIDYAKICVTAEEARVAIQELNRSQDGTVAVRGASAGVGVMGVDTAADVRGGLFAYNADATKPVLFFDYHLGSGPTGMDLFSDIDFDAEKYLITGHFDNPDIRRQCEVAKVHLLPKSQLADVLIVVV